MIYIFFVSFIFFSVIDYIYIYSFLDSKLLFTRHGSKLKTYIKESSIKKNYKEKLDITAMFYKENLMRLSKDICIFLTTFILLFLISFLFFKNILTSNFVVLNTGYKKIDVVSSFGKYWSGFKCIYYISYAIFLFLIISHIQKKINTLLKKRDERKVMQALIKKQQREDIYLGRSGEDEVYIKEHGLYQNILITGSIGAGKTTGAISTLCDNLIKKGYGGVIMDVKGTYVENVKKMSEKYGRGQDVVVISNNNNVLYNPLGGDVKEIELANRVRQVIQILSPPGNSDTYWLDKVENVLFNMIILIKYYTNGKVDFSEIHKLVTSEEYLVEKIEESKGMLRSCNMSDKIAFELSNVFLFFEKEYFNLENRVLSIIKSEITRITIPFVTDYEIYSKFGRDNKGSISLDICKSNSIFVLSINIAENKVLFKILATFLKLEFQKQVLKNISAPIPTFFILDEYQEFANVEDAHFLSLSREAKCINVISMQSYSSLTNSLKNETASSVIIQNLVSKIWFRNDDNYTVGQAIKQIGKEQKVIETKAVSESSQEAKKYIARGGFKNKKSNISETLSYSNNKDNVYDENTFTRELKTYEAIALLSDGEKMEDIQKIKFERKD